MNKQKSQQQKNNPLKNKLGMEGRIPTMPEMYNRNFKILRSNLIQQAKTSWVEYIPPHPVVCPRCKHDSLKHYDHYSRKSAFINYEGVRRTLLIKAKRYKCQHCSSSSGNP